MSGARLLPELYGEETRFARGIPYFKESCWSSSPQLLAFLAENLLNARSFVPDVGSLTQGHGGTKNPDTNAPRWDLPARP